MGNRAAALRAAVLAAYPEAEIDARGPNWIRHRLPDGKRSLDAVIGLLHYDGDNEIDTTVEDSDDANFDDKVDKLPYRLYQRDGDRRIYPRRGVLTEYISLGRPEFRRPNGTYAAIPFTGKTRTDNVISFSGNGYRLDVIAGPTRLKMNLVLESAPAATRWRFPISITGLTRQGANLIADSDGAVVARVAPFTLTDSSPFPIERDVPGQLTSHPTYQGAYVVEPDLSGLTYPVVIDPTIDVSVANNADDAYWNAGGTFDATLTLTAFGVSSTLAHHAMLRFDNITVPALNYITAAYLTVVPNSTQTSANTDSIIYGVDEDDSAAATSAADANGRSLTTANTVMSNVASWTAGTPVNSDSIVDIVQEIVDRAGWASGNAIQIFWKDNGSSNEHFRHIATIEHATYAAPAIHIEYTDDYTISAAHLGPTSVLYAPTLNVSYTIAAAAIASGSQLYAATLTPGVATISAALLGPTSSLYAPTISPTYTISAATIASGSQLYAATLTPSLTISAAFISSGSTLYASTITPGAITISAALLGPTSTFYTATITVGATTISAVLLGPTAVLYAPAGVGSPGFIITDVTVGQAQLSALVGQAALSVGSGQAALAVVSGQASLDVAVTQDDLTVKVG